jgi:hypothetical protein
MSTDTRKKLVDDSRLVLARHSQREDLLDTNKTNTWLVQFLITLLDTCKHPILITALNTDHGRAGSNHARGRAVDCWHANWAAVGDEQVLAVMQAAAKIGATKKPALIEVGLSGMAANYMTHVTWPTSNVFVEDWGRNNEHLHFAFGTPT